MLPGIEDGFKLNPYPEKSSTDIIMSDFCSWWRNLPTDMKKSKSRAWISYRKARLKATAGDLEDGIAAYVRHKPAWQCYAHASTWLNNERWNDEYAVSKQDQARATYRDWSESCEHQPKCSHPTTCQHLRDVATYKASKSLDKLTV